MSTAGSTPVRALQSAVAGTLGLGGFPGARRWSAAMFIDALGTGLLTPLTVLYFTLHVGLSAPSVGVGLTLGGIIALCTTPVAGLLIDGIGSRPTLMGCWALAAAAYVGYAFVHSWAEFLIAATAALISSYAASPAKKGVLTELLVGEDRVRALASQRALRNLGFGLGGLIATGALALGGAAYVAVVSANAFSFCVAIILLAGLTVPRHRRPAAPSRRIALVLADRRYLTLTALDLLTTFYQTAFEIALPVWLVLHTHAPRALAGVLFTLNTACVVLFQVRVSHGISAGRDAIVQISRRSAGLMALAAGAYLAAHYAGAVVGVLLLIAGLLLNTGTEMLSSTVSWAVSVEFSPPDQRGMYLSVFSLGGSLQQAIGPVIVSAALVLGGTYLWPLLAALVCAGSLATARVVESSGPPLSAAEERSPARGGPVAESS